MLDHLTHLYLWMGSEEDAEAEETGIRSGQIVCWY